MKMVCDNWNISTALWLKRLETSDICFLCKNKKLNFYKADEISLKWYFDIQLSSTVVKLRDGPLHFCKEGGRLGNWVKEFLLKKIVQVEPSSNCFLLIPVLFLTLKELLRKRAKKLMHNTLVGKNSFLVS